MLVVLSLRGGFDGLNTVVPTADPRYRAGRPNIGIPQNALFPLDAMFGLHPAMAVADAVLGRRQSRRRSGGRHDEPNRSHFEAMEEMERAAPGTSVRTGWLDRTLGLRDAGRPRSRACRWAAAWRPRRSGGQLAGARDVVGGLLRPFRRVGRRPNVSVGTRRCEGLHTDAPDPIGCARRDDARARSSTAGDLQDAGYTPDHGADYPEHRARASAARRGAGDQG